MRKQTFTPQTKMNEKSINVGSSRFNYLLALVSTIVIGGYVYTQFFPVNSSNIPFDSELEIRILTQNIRFDNVNYPAREERPWTERKKHLISALDFNTHGDNSIICLQEALHHQIIDILAGLNNNNPPESEFIYYGVGRDDGKLAGEFAPILFRKSEWSIKESKTYWLSETPKVPSRGWDAALPRILTKVVLKSKRNPLIVINLYNTHFDHQGKIARKHSAEFISKKLKTNEANFFCGDLNTEPTDEPYKILTEAGINDSRLLVNQDYAYGFETTYTGFRDEDCRTIDYIWSSPGSKKYYYHETGEPDYQIKIRQFAILPNYFRGFHYSDHRPVVSNYRISKNNYF